MIRGCVEVLLHPRDTPNISVSHEPFLPLSFTRPARNRVAILPPVWLPLNVVWEQRVRNLLRAEGRIVGRAEGVHEITTGGGPAGDVRPPPERRHYLPAGLWLLLVLRRVSRCRC